MTKLVVTMTSSRHGFVRCHDCKVTKVKYSLIFIGVCHAFRILLLGAFDTVCATEVHVRTSCQRSFCCEEVTRAVFFYSWHGYDRVPAYTNVSCICFFGYKMGSAINKGLRSLLSYEHTFVFDSVPLCCVLLRRAGATWLERRSSRRDETHRVRPGSTPSVGLWQLPVDQWGVRPHARPAASSFTCNGG